MAILKNNEIKTMNEKDLAEKFKSLNEEIVKIKAQIAMGTLPKNPGKVKEIKRTIARIKTLRGGVNKE